MDRYLFRGKRLDNGEWVQGHYVVASTNIDFHSIMVRGVGVMVDPATIGQCTGVKLQFPPYEKCFFENDIVKAYWHDADGNLISRIMVVCYIDGAFVGKSITDSAVGSLIEIAERGGELIGNMHDHPELLRA